MVAKRSAKEAGLAQTNGQSKKAATESNGASGLRDRFGPALFDEKIVRQYAEEYASSEPYKHAVVSGLIDDSLLRSVRSEIVENIHFTPKETDIYKIHQSGDLANLDGLDAAALEKLPSLLKLRDALYGSDFRNWISEVSGAGPVSGRKTDMAVNVYVPGCHLLCHDDVIGTRRVSYILYLTDPDKPWRAEWGGALRLYPVVNDEKGNPKYKGPSDAWSKVIPPAWNQLSFFAVQPGQSFHDVEEVYARGAGEDEDDGGRVRMAISGWFHIPQEGEEGYEPGLEEKLAKESSLQQLQGKNDEFDQPKWRWNDPSRLAWDDEDKKEMRKSVQEEEAQKQSAEESEEPELTQHDIDTLLRFIFPQYLVPDTVAELRAKFVQDSMLELGKFLNKNMIKASSSVRHKPSSKRVYETAKPPYKHRYHFIHGPVRDDKPGKDLDEYDSILSVLLPSVAFHKWLTLVTGLELGRVSHMGRHFRKGLDYELAQTYDGEMPQLEYCLNITDWDAQEEQNDTKKTQSNGAAKTADQVPDEDDECGGYELYMAGEDPDDEDDDENDDAGSDHGVEVPTNPASHTGAGDRRSAKQPKKNVDPAVYQSAPADGEEDDGDDGILHTNSPNSFNTLTLVLRDRGTMKFVKYLSRSARGDRWDFAGRVQVKGMGEEFEFESGDEEEEEEGDDEDEGEGAGEGAAVIDG